MLILHRAVCCEIHAAHRPRALHELLQTTLERQRQLAQLWQAARDYPQALKVWQQVAGASGQTADRLQVAWLHYQQAQWQDVLAMVQGIQPASAAQRRQLASLRAAAQQALGMDQ